MKLILKMLAPWIAVGLCWCVFKNGWLAILTYHAQILIWNRKPSLQIAWRERLKPFPPFTVNHDEPRPEGLRPFQPYKQKRWLLTALPTILTGPLVYFLLPHITHTELGTWLTEYHLTGWKLLLMVPTFGIIHPMLEQLHWKPLREQTRFAHLFFAGYHMLVLFSLVKTPWLIFCFTGLTAASFAWKWLTQKSGSMTAAILSHILADLGMIVTATFMMSCSPS